jgi:excisionase family DNA binding protein
MTEMLTAKEMQELLQVDRSTIYRMAEAGRLPAMKVGKQWRFPSHLVEQWLGTQATTSDAPLQATPVKLETTAGELASLLPLACVQLIQDTYADALGVMLVVTDMEGNPVTEVSRPCGLFEAISDKPNALKKCIESWHSLATVIDLEPKFMQSHLGLLCARGLIRVGTELKGMVVMGCIAPDNWPPAAEKIGEMAAEFDVAPEKIAAHVNEAFYLDKAERARVLSFIQRIADIVAHIVTERHSLMGKLESISAL